jgi:predicted DNA-binding transcriptional regulator YafY
MTATARTARQIRRAIRAALHAGRQLVTAARGARFRVLVAIYRALDHGAALRIAYTDRDGVHSVRTITPRRLDVTATGNITCRAFDHRDGEDTTFRTDRMQIAA